MRTLLLLLIALILPQTGFADDLESAVKREKTDQIRQLIAAGADVNKRYGRKRTVLHLAAEHGRLRSVQLLVNNGADMNVQDSNGDTPLHVAVAYTHLPVVRFLLEFGADHRIKNDAGRNVETHAEHSASAQRTSPTGDEAEKITRYLSKTIRNLPPPRASGIFRSDGTEKSRWGETEPDDTVTIDLGKFGNPSLEVLRSAARVVLDYKGWTHVASEADREVGSYYQRLSSREYRAEIRFRGNRASVSYLRGYDARRDKLLKRLADHFQKELKKGAAAPAR